MRKSPLLLVVGILSLSMMNGCAGMSVAQATQTAGTIAGSAIAPGVGAPLGALIGLLAGMAIQGEVDKTTEKHERQDLGRELSTPSSSTTPSEAGLASGQPTRVWVDETMQEGRLVAGHFEVRHIP